MYDACVYVFVRMRVRFSVLRNRIIPAGYAITHDNSRASTSEAPAAAAQDDSNAISFLETNGAHWCTCVYVRMYMCVCTYVCICVYVRMYVGVLVCMH